MKGKDSFIMYTSYLAVFEKLSDIEAGKLIKHILRYVNDQNPSIEDNRLLDIIFENIKHDLKEDLKKWNERCETNKKNGFKGAEFGKLGGRPKKETNHEKPRTGLENPEKPRKTPEYEYEDEYDINNNIPPIIPLEGKTKTWRDDFNIYLESLREAFDSICLDHEFLKTQEKYNNPDLDILKTIEKSCVNYWSKEIGWKHKKKSKSKEIDWKQTFINAISLKSNQVWKK